MLKNRKLLLMMFLSVVTLLFFINCNKISWAAVNTPGLDSSNIVAGSGTDPADSPISPTSTTSPSPNVPVVQQACGSTSHQKITLNYFFPKPNFTCEWGKGGNLMELDLHFQARIEQEQALVMGPNTIICDVKFDFAQQQFLYDDHFLLTFDNAVIASSYNFGSKLTSQANLLRYDWKKIAGMYWDKTQEGTYCPANSTCSWPETDVPGTIKISYPSSVFQQLVAEDLTRTSHSLKFVAIGDNDADDCEHTDIRFSIEVDFVTKP